MLWKIIKQNEAPAYQINSKLPLESITNQNLSSFFQKPVIDPADEDLVEIEVLRYMFDLKQEKVEVKELQEHLITYRKENKAEVMKKVQKEIRNGNLVENAASLLAEISSPKRKFVHNDDIPEPLITFTYVKAPDYPTPTPTPEPAKLTEEMPIDYTKASKKKENFQIKDRCEFIKLKEDDKPPKPRLVSPSPDPESDPENFQLNSQLVPTTKSLTWVSSSIYNNLPELAMSEYDKMMRDAHSLKCEVVDALNKEFPVSYDYNPKKSRIRTNYSDPQIADDRTRNNVASRRSRQRKKFQVQMIQYSVDYDVDENFLLEKQEDWLRTIITGLEHKVMAADEENAKVLKKLRKQCGFE